MTRVKFEHLIAFCISMQYGEGIRSKEPRRVIRYYEKIKYCYLSESEQRLYDLYMTKYNVKDKHFEDD